jgi:hypothetical protein
MAITRKGAFIFVLATLGTTVVALVAGANRTYPDIGEVSKRALKVERGLREPVQGFPIYDAYYHFKGVSQEELVDSIKKARPGESIAVTKQDKTVTVAGKDWNYTSSAIFINCEMSWVADDACLVQVYRDATWLEKVVWRIRNAF